MARKRWNELSDRTRTFIVVATVFDGLAKITALADLRRRPDEEIHGSKRVWAACILLVNSVGVLPLVYFLTGRRTRDAD